MRRCVFVPPATAEAPAGIPLKVAGPSMKPTRTRHKAVIKRTSTRKAALFYVAAGEKPIQRWKRAPAGPWQIKTGISDGNFTEVVEGLNEDAEIVVGMSPAKTTNLRTAGIFSGAGAKH